MKTLDTSKFGDGRVICCDCRGCSSSLSSTTASPTADTIAIFRVFWTKSSVHHECRVVVDDIVFTLAFVSKNTFSESNTPLPFSSSAPSVESSPLYANTEQVIEINAINFNFLDNVLQSLQQWQQYAGEAGSDIPSVVDYRMERVIRIFKLIITITMKISLTRYV